MNNLAPDLRFARGYGRRVHILDPVSANNPARYRSPCLCGNFADQQVVSPTIGRICKSCLKSAKAAGLVKGEPCSRCAGSGVEP